MARRKAKAPAEKHNGDADFVWLRDWHCHALLAVLVAVYFREVILQHAFFWEDFIYQFYPYRSFASAAFVNGEIPLWNPYTFGGMPFLADITGTVMYLPHLLLLPFVAGGKLHFWYVEMYIIVHAFLAGTTMFYCARHFGATRVAASFSALVYTFSGFLVLHIIHLVTICQIAWFPLVVLLFSRMLKEQSVRDMLLAGFVLSMIVCGGHIQITLYFFLFLFAFFVYEMVFFARDEVRVKKKFSAKPLAVRSCLAAGVIVFAVALAAVQLLPTSELADLSLRESITYAKASEGQLYWQQLITLIIPKFFGTSNALGGENPHPYWGPEVQWAYWETALYMGIAALVLALFALSLWRSNRHVGFLAGFALFALLYALGDNFFVHRLFYDFVPGFGRFRSMGRWTIFIAFAVALLSGFGLQRIISSTAHSKVMQRILAVVGVLVLALTVAVRTRMLDGFIQWQAGRGALSYASPEQVFPLAQQIAAKESLVAAGIALLTIAFLYALLMRKIPLRWGVALVFLVQYVDMYVFGFEHNNGKLNPDEHFGERAQVVELLKEEGKTEFFRVNARNGSGIYLDRNQGMIDRLFLTEGYSQLALQRRFPPAATEDRMYNLLNTKYRLKTDTVEVQNQPRLTWGLVADSAYLPRAFFVYRYNVFATAQAESLFMRSTGFDPRRMVALEQNPNVSLADPVPGERWSATIQSYSLNRIVINATTPRRGILVLSEIFYPGWNAYIDGVSVQVFRANWNLRAFVVDAGEHRVEVRFEPKSFSTGATVSLSAFALGFAGFVFSLLQQKLKRRPDLTHTVV